MVWLWLVMIFFIVLAFGCEIDDLQSRIRKLENK